MADSKHELTRDQHKNPLFNIFFGSTLIETIFPTTILSSWEPSVYVPLLSSFLLLRLEMSFLRSFLEPLDFSLISSSICFSSVASQVGIKGRRKDQNHKPLLFLIRLWWKHVIRDEIVEPWFDLSPHTPMLLCFFFDPSYLQSRFPTDTFNLLNGLTTKLPQQDIKNMKNSKKKL